MDHFVGGAEHRVVSSIKAADRGADHAQITTRTALGEIQMGRAVDAARYDNRCAVTERGADDLVIVLCIWNNRRVQRRDAKP